MIHPARLCSVNWRTVGGVHSELVLVANPITDGLSKPSAPDNLHHVLGL